MASTVFAPQAIIPPIPMPRSARPGGYSVTSAAVNPYAPRPGLLSLLLGADNPLAKWAAENRSFLTEAGTGLANGMKFGDLAGAREADMDRAYRADQWAKGQQGQKSTADALSRRGYADLAEAVTSGAMTPGDAFNESIRRQQDDQKRSREQSQWQAYSKFLKDPSLAQMVASGALPFEDAYKMQMGASGAPGTVSTQPQYFTDPATGQVVLGQLSDTGKLVRTDTGGLSPISPFDMAGGKASSVVDAKTAGAARAALPSLEQNVTLAQKALDLVTGDEAGLNDQFGQAGFLPRNLWVQGGTPMGNWVANFDQAKGQAFMQARQALKGGGQITDFEGKRAEAAYSRMEAAARTGDKATFLSAAADFSQAMDDGLAKLRATANGGYAAGSPAITGGSSPYDRYGLEPAGQ